MGAVRERPGKGTLRAWPILKEREKGQREREARGRHLEGLADLEGRAEDDGAHGAHERAHAHVDHVALVCLAMKGEGGGR